MAIKHFTITVDTGSSGVIVTDRALIDLIQANWSVSLLSVTGSETDIDAPTALPWRVVRDGRTVAAVEDSTKALAVLEELADDLTLWRLEFHMAAV